MGGEKCKWVARASCAILRYVTGSNCVRGEIISEKELG